ncbi:udp-glycosyltransferase 89a2 [Quercus suber]|uniref:Udp-glycosyltransferase 89a2 n=1 Tax=Quercus suber TaxID=58331 RepID=A0AAW0KH13_QUESU
MSSSSQSHILVFPYPAQGHMLPLLDLTHQLSLRGSTITILVTPKNLPTLTPLLSSNPSIQTLVLPFPPHPQLPHGVENVRDVGNAGNLHIMTALTNLYDPLLHWFTSHPSPPIAIISDFFLGWTLRLAIQLNIPRIVFFSSGAFLASVHYNLWPATNAQALRSLPTLDFPDLPGSPSFKQDHLPSLWRFYNESNPETHFIKDGMLANTASWGCVFNSFHELEGHYLDYLRKNSRVYGVGPLSLVGITSGGVGRGNPDSHSGNDDHVKTWLDGCLEGSVLYVCFGSQKMLNKQQVEGLASGLEKRSFWNSVLEAIVGGVIILGWPMEADQFVNAKLLVEDMGVAVWVCEGTNSVPDPDHLARVFDESMLGDGATKVRAKELRDKAFEAVSGRGSSSADLDALVKDLGQLSSAPTVRE